MADRITEPNNPDETGYLSRSRLRAILVRTVLVVSSLPAEQYGTYLRTYSPA